MNYSDFEKALSPPLPGRFLIAAKGYRQKALQFYKLNMIFPAVCLVF
jgi:hypothetical protein